MGRLDEVFQALSDRDRREVLYTLYESEDEDEEAEVVPVDAVIDNPENRIEFHHQHLPMLEQKGLIEWDKSDEHIREGPIFNEVVPVIETLEEHSNFP